MMIVPAILSQSREEFLKMLNNCSSFTNYVQIDIMDGKFVSSKSIDRIDLKGIKPSINSEAHLMVEEPLEWLDVFKEFKSKRIIFHFEIKKNHLKIIESIRSKNLEVGIAVNPYTKIEEFEFLLEKVDTVLFMSVEPGFYGSSFIPRVLEKIKEFKKLYPNKTIGIDGGIKLDNFKEVKNIGVDYICIGSAILKAKNPKEAYFKFLNLIDE